MACKLGTTMPIDSMTDDRATHAVSAGACGNAILVIKGESENQ
jgi:hypothetical protein